MIRNAIVVVSLALLGASLPAGASDRAEEAFQQLKTLKGSWNVETPNGPGTITYRVGSAGSIVIEELFPGTPHEMMTIYHLDGDELVATHYCAAGNQPRFKLAPAKAASDAYHFAFTGGSNMKPEDGHIHEGTIKILGPDSVESTWSYWEHGEPEQQMTFKMKRIVGSPSTPNR
jgi:hypothetical protein